MTSSIDCNGRSVALERLSAWPCKPLNAARYVAFSVQAGAAALPEDLDALLRAWVLMDLEDRLQGHDMELASYALPGVSAEERERVMAADARMRVSELPRTLREEMCYDAEEQAAAAAAHQGMLTDGQRAVTEHVLAAVREERPAAVFVHANAGCGKTFTFNTLLEAVRGEGHAALAVASSGIAATLMKGGRTAHSRFKLPLDPTATSVCNYGAQSDTAKLLRAAKLIVWDEAPMAHRHLLETLDRSLKDTMGNNLPFGGKVIVLAGDYRQTLPVIPRGNRGQIVGATHPRSTLWQHFQVFFLKDNMRVLMAGGDQVDSQWYMDWLLQLGDGRLPPSAQPGPDTPEDFVDLPARLCMERSLRDDLINFVFPDLLRNYTDHQWMAERAILAPHNATVWDINNHILSLMPSEEQVFYSSDQICPGDHNTRLEVPVEYLNTLAGGGLPPHELRLKTGIPVMLMRNLDPSNGLCNGTRLIVDQVINGRVLKATIAGTDRTVMIPRIDLSPKDGMFPFEWKRRQFPVRVAFAMTINKSQGQTLKRVGIDLLMKPVFTHGQLYVASSRVGDPQHIRFLLPAGATRNVVYRDVLLTDET